MNYLTFMKKKILGYIFILLTVFFITCASVVPSAEPTTQIETKPDVRNDWYSKFVGEWTEDNKTTGTYQSFIFREDGTANHIFFSNNKIVEVRPLRYDGNNDSAVMTFSYIPIGVYGVTYVFIDDNTLSLNDRYSWRVILKRIENSNSPAVATKVEDAVSKAAIQVLKNVPKRLGIAIVYITAPDRNITDYIAGELEFIWVNDGYFITDRSQLDRLRREQNFQLSGEVDDATAVSIGKFSGANIIVTGRVDGEGNLRRLRLRALDVQTAQVIGVASEKF
jgi:hypothetical protein